MKKIFIIYHNQELIDSYIDQILEKSDDISFAKKFTSDENDTTKIYMSPVDVKLCLKNNAILYIITRDYVSSGITLDEFYNNNICLLHYDEFNEISNVVFNKHDILTLWIDSKIKHGMNAKLQQDITCLEQRLETLKYEYFLNDKFEDIYKVIIDFLFNENDNNEGED